LRRNIYVTDCEENHISKGIQGSKSACPVFHDFDDSIESLGYGIGQTRFDERDYLGAVISEGIDQFSHGFETSSEGCGSPAFEESFSGPLGLEVPEVLKFVLEKPSPVDAAVASLQSMEDTRIVLWTGGGVFEKEPAQAFKYFAFLGGGFPPLLLADFIKGCIDRLDDVKTIQDQGGVTAMLLNGPKIGFTHITGGPKNLVPLIGREAFLKEEVDRIPALTLADPNDARPIQVINDGGILAAFAIGDLIHAEGGQPSDPMAIARSHDALVEEIRKGGGRDMKEPGGGLLRHQLAVYEQGILKAIGDTSVGFCPGDSLLDSAMSGTEDLLGVIAEKDAPSTDGHVAPYSGWSAYVEDGAPALTLRASATAFVGSHPNMQRSVSYFEVVINHKDLFQTEQRYDKLSHKAHGFLPFQWKCKLLENRRGTYGLIWAQCKSFFVALEQEELKLPVLLAQGRNIPRNRSSRVWNKPYYPGITNSIFTLKTHLGNPDWPKKVKELLGTGADLDFLLVLKRKGLEKLVTCIRGRLHQVSESGKR
jgi:hypothetical protein